MAEERKLRVYCETTPDYLKAKSNNSVDSLTKQNGSYYLIEAMADVRAGQTSWFLRNTRNYDGVQNGSLQGFENLPSVYPYRVTDGGPNGLAYMSCGAGNGLLVKGNLAAGTTLSVSSTGNIGSKTLSLHADNTGLWLTVAPSGTLILFK